MKDWPCKARTIRNPIIRTEENRTVHDKILKFWHVHVWGRSKTYVILPDAKCFPYGRVSSRIEVVEEIWQEGSLPGLASLMKGIGSTSSWSTNSWLAKSWVELERPCALMRSCIARHMKSTTDCGPSTQWVALPMSERAAPQASFRAIRMLHEATIDLW